MATPCEIVFGKLPTIVEGPSEPETRIEVIFKLSKE